MRNFYYVGITEDNGKRGASVLTMSEGGCVMGYIKGLNLTHLYPFETKKKAEEVAKDWNETAKSEGKNLW